MARRKNHSNAEKDISPAPPAYEKGSASNSSYARASYAGSVSRQLEVNFDEIFQKIWRRKGLIIITVLLCMAATTVIILQLTPRYYAESVIMIEAQGARTANIGAIFKGLSGDEETIQSEIEVIKSRDIIRAVIIALRLDKNPEFNTSLALKGFFGVLKERVPGLLKIIPEEWMGVVVNEKSKPEKSTSQKYPSSPISDNENVIKTETRTIDAFLDKLSVNQKGRSRVIGIGVTSRNPVIAAEASNLLTDLYIQQLVDMKIDTDRQATSWLDKRVKVLRQQVKSAEAKVERYREKSGLIETRGVTVSSQQVAELSTQVVIARTKRVEADARLRQASSLLNSPQGVSSAAEVLDSSLIQKLREKEAEIQRRESELSQEYGKRHPKIINVRAELRDLESKITIEVSKIFDKMRNESIIARTREKSLTRTLDKMKSEVAKANKAEVGLRALEREAKATRTLLETFLSRYKEVSVQKGQDIQRPDIRIISKAEVPLDPTYPKKGIIYVLALFGSIGFSVMLSFLVEMLDRGFRTGDQIENLTGVAVLGIIPLLSGKKNAREPVTDYVLRNPISAFSEAIRTIHTSLLLTQVDKPPTKILITSAQPDEGKTTITINLARMLAMAGRRVLIIDADFRRPAISKLLGLDNQRGFVDLLLGEADCDDVISEDSASGAFVIPAGMTNQNLPTLFPSDRMSQVFEILDQSFDFMIIDSPPILAVSDARILSTKVDATVFVVRWADTSRDMVMTAFKQLGIGDESVVGFVLSMVDLKKNAKYKYSDSYQYNERIKKYYSGPDE